MNIPSFLNKIQLTQCYHCFDWCHKRNACPNRSDPVTCSHCAGSDHNYLECKLPLLCTNCDGAHAATYRGCPSHQTALNTVMNEIQNHFNANNNSATTPQSIEQDTNNIIRAARLASNTPQEFATELFAAATSLISPPNSNQTDLNISATDQVATRLTFGCESEDIESEIDEIEEVAPTLNEPPTEISPTNHTNKINDLRQQLEKDLESDINKWTKSIYTTFGDQSRPESAEPCTISTSTRDQSITLTILRDQSEVLIQKDQIVNVKLGEWPHYVDFIITHNGKEWPVRIKVYDHKQNRSPENAKRLLDHCTNVLEFPTH